MSSQVRQLLEAMPAAFMPDKAGSAKALIQLDLAGEGGGQWVLDIAQGECQVTEAKSPKPDVTVSMDAQDFAALYNNQLNPVQAFMAGKIKVTGNVGLVMQLLNWFDR
ncbi:MAG: SCP2 sterol-binding domain-containing protein [Anaerolineae bacterium]|jgi:putative sterol carrier protein